MDGWMDRWINRKILQVHQLGNALGSPTDASPRPAPPRVKIPSIFDWLRLGIAKNIGGSRGKLTVCYGKWP